MSSVKVRSRFNQYTGPKQEYQRAEENKKTLAELDRIAMKHANLEFMRKMGK